MEECRSRMTGDLRRRREREADPEGGEFPTLHRCFEPSQPATFPRFHPCPQQLRLGASARGGASGVRALVTTRPLPVCRSVPVQTGNPPCAVKSIGGLAFAKPSDQGEHEFKPMDLFSRIGRRRSLTTDLPLTMRKLDCQLGHAARRRLTCKAFSIHATAPSRQSTGKEPLKGMKALPGSLA